MEWRKCYLDVILVPLGFFILTAYHLWLWYKVRTQPETTLIGINSSGRRLWVAAIVKVYILFLLLVYLFIYLNFLIWYSKQTTSRNMTCILFLSATFLSVFFTSLIFVYDHGRYVYLFIRIPTNLLLQPSLWRDQLAL